MIGTSKKMSTIPEVPLQAVPWRNFHPRCNLLVQKTVARIAALSIMETKPPGI